MQNAQLEISGNSQFEQFHLVIPYTIFPSFLRMDESKLFPDDVTLLKLTPQLWLIVNNRPNVRNAVNLTISKKLYSAFKQFDLDSESRVAVFYGAGGNFCAGGDLIAANTDKCVPFISVEESDIGPMGEAVIHNIHRRKLLAMIDLVGIEPNPGYTVRIIN